MIIKRIRLLNWKNFQDVDVILGERCFIVGANASGKSNFIDALRFLRDIVKQSGGLQEAVESRGGVTKIRCLAAKSKPGVSIEVELGDVDVETPTWIYHLSFQHKGGTGGIHKSQAEIISEKVYSGKAKRWILERPNKNDEDKETLKYTYLEQITANKDFREIQGFFENIEYLNIVPQLVRESNSIYYKSSEEDYYGRNFLENVAKKNTNTRNAHFRRISEVLKIAVPQLQELEFIRDPKTGIPHLEAKYIHWRAKGAKQQEQQFSDGTLRLIGFLFALLDFNSVILLEEPEINLHTEIIKRLPEFISKIQRSRKPARQVVITTHSYEMLSGKGVGMNEVLVLNPSKEGTTITTAADMKGVKQTIAAGFSVADAVVPLTKPEDVEQLTLKLDL
jgi:predicted ATPase